MISETTYQPTSTKPAVASLALTMLLSSLGTSIANVALPTLARAFDASFQDVQWVVLAYLLSITALIVSAGRLGDVIGRRRLILAGLVLFTVASTACGAAPRLWLLVAARALQGLGAAIMMALVMALISEAVPKDKTGSAMGLLGTMSAIGTALGPSLGGMLIAAFGWRAIFFINLPLGLLALLLAWQYLPADPPSSNALPTRFDIPGTLMLAATLIAYALAMTVGRGTFGPVNAALLLAAMVAGGLFTAAESRASSPLVRLALFRQTALSAGFAMNAIVTTVVMATLVVGPFYLSGALALDAGHVGLVMSSGPVVSALTGIPAGRLADRFGPRRMTTVGLIGMVTGSALLATTPASFGVPGYVAPLVVITAGYALFQAANNTAVMANVRADQRGVVSGILNLSRNLGLVTGTAVMGAVFAWGAGTSSVSNVHPDTVAAGLHATFATATVLIAIALATAFIARKAPERR